MSFLSTIDRAAKKAVLQKDGRNLGVDCVCYDAGKFYVNSSYNMPVLKVVQERSRLSPAIRGRVPPPQILLLFIFDLKMASFDAFLVVFHVI